MKFSTVLVLLFIYCLQVISQEKIEFYDSTFQLKSPKRKNQPQDLIDTMAQKTKYGAFINYGLNLHFADFNKLPDVPSCCPAFTGGIGPTLNLGLLMDLFFNNEIFINFRAGFSTFHTLMKSEEPTTVIIDGKSRDGKFEHRLDADIYSLSFEPNLMYKLSNRLYAHGGIRLGFGVYNHYHQIEEIIDPPDRGTFIDGKRTRNDNSGKIPDASIIQAGIMLGISYELPLNKKNFIFLYPEFFYTFNFLPVVPNTGWTIHTIRAGLSVKYRQPPPPPPPPPPPAIPPNPQLPKPPVPPKITVAVDAIQIDSNNVEQKGISLKIEDFISHNMRPLLTYVFFDENSDKIPNRYIRLSPEETKDFNLKKLQNYDALETYYHVLNIIGKRLSQTDAKIKLIGTNSNQGEEKGNKDLSERRALAVRNYLRDIWGISEDRIKIEARNLPKEASREDEIEGIEENRRVEIISDDWSITEPVITVDTVRKISKSTIRFLPSGKADAGISSWNLKAKENNKELISFEGIGTLPTQLNWEINDNDTSSPSRGGKIEYTFSITDSLGQTASTSTKQLPVEQLTIDMKRIEMIADREFEYYSLILFDFGSSKLGDEHKKVLDFVKGRITDKSIVTITGYTDKIGDEEVNLKLSTERAKSAYSKLKIPNAIVKGVGESELLYDNSLPEGRFYCRTVKITIETPVEHNNGEKKEE